MVTTYTVKTDTEVRAGQVVLVVRDVRDRTRDRTRDYSPTRVRTRGLGRSLRRGWPCRVNSTRSATVRVNAVTFVLTLVLVLVRLPVPSVADRLVT